MRWFYPVFLLGLATSSVLCREANAQLIVSDPTADPAEVANALSDAANAATDAKELTVITSKVTDGVPLPNPDPIAAAAALQEQLVTPTPTSGVAAELDEANTAEATANATAGGGGGPEELAVAENLDQQALTELDEDAAESAVVQAKDVGEIEGATNEEELIGAVADLEEQNETTELQLVNAQALTTLSANQYAIDEANKEKSAEQDHEETAALFSVASAP
jgi:hypothetical protein